MAHRAPIVLQDYSESWPARFAEERELLESATPAHFRLEHIGSTAVPGMRAKPIIDMMLGANALSEIDALARTFATLGYEYMPQHETSFPQRRFYAKPVVRPRVFHLHGVVHGETFWTEHISFRDFLRSNPDLARKYSAVKTHLAEKFVDDRTGYTAAKSDFINEALRFMGSGKKDSRQRQ